MPDKDSKLHSVSRSLWNLCKSVSLQFGKLFDKIIYNGKASLIVSGLFAVIFCISINYQELSFEFFHSDVSTLNLSSVPVEVLIDTESFEVNGLPNTADLAIQGDPADIQLVRTQNSASVQADLRTLEPGTNMVPLKATGLPSGLDVTVTPSSAEVDIQRKYTRSYTVTPELLLGKGQRDGDFETPVLSVKSVTIKATKSKLDTIRLVKAIIDTSGKNDDFRVTAPLVAYDAAGKQINVTITPESVEATVKRADSSANSSANSSDSAANNSANGSAAGSNNAAGTSGATQSFDSGQAAQPAQNAQGKDS